MAYSDANYEWVTSGSTGASADTAHLLFGAYQGLSTLLNQSDVVHLQLLGLSSSFRVGPDNTVTNDSGFKVGSTWEDMPPLRAGAASGFHLANDTIGTNASAAWVVWKRKPL